MPGNANPGFQCQFCQTAFSRQEHLSRHVRTHTHEKPYPCPQCNKSFSRQDVLSRHVLSHKFHPRNRRVISMRACYECANTRVRCSKDTPCKRCADRDLECSYPPSRKRRASLSEQSDAEGDALPAQSAIYDDLSRNMDHVMIESTQAPEVGPGSAMIAQMPHNSDSQGLGIPFQDTTSSTYIGSIPQVAAWARGIEAPNTLEPSQAGPSDYSTTVNLGSLIVDQNMDSSVFGTSNVNWLSPCLNNTLDWNDGWIGLPFNNTSFDSIAWIPSSNEDDAVGSSSSRPNPEPVVTSSAAEAMAIRQNTQGSPAGQTFTPNQNLTDSTTSQSTEGVLYVDGAASRAPFRGRLLRRQSIYGNDSVPEGSTPGSEAVTSPNTHHTSNVGASLVSDLAYETMRRGIQVDSEAHSLEIDYNLIPGPEHVRRFTHLYFDKFHPTYPFIQRSASVFQQSNSWILLLAVAAMGARYSPDYQHSPLSDIVDKLLSARTRDLEAGMDDGPWTPQEEEPQPKAELPFLQAGILHLISMLHSGNKRLIKHALARRYRLVEYCRRMNLLARNLPEPQKAIPDGHPNFISAWIQAQSEIRTGMMLWLIDSLVAFEFNCSNLFQLNEVKSPLPSPEKLWEDPTFDLLKDEASATVTLAEALELLYMEKRLSPNLSEFSTILLIYAVCQRTREAYYQHSTMLSSWIPNARVQPRSESQRSRENSWPPTNHLALRWRNSACDCLDIIHWVANSIAAKAGGWEHPTILHLHLSRLLLLSPTDHIQNLAAAISLNKPSESGEQNSRHEETYNNVRKWAVLDQYKARLAAIHAGAVFWHIRRYSSHSFIDPFATYLAALVLWSYSISMQSTTVPQANDRDVQVQDPDPKTSENPPSQNQISPRSSSEEEEKPEVSFIYLDRPCDDEMVQSYVRLGRQMEANMVRVGNICTSGAPQKILREGLRLLSGDKNWTSHKVKAMPSPNLCNTVDTWSIRQGFMNTLVGMVRAT